MARKPECIRFADRNIVVVWIPSIGRQGYYQSTGNNSGNPGRWYPFDGCVGLIGGWFAKHRFGTEPVETDEMRQDPLNRYRYPIYKEVGDWLAERQTKLVPTATYGRFDGLEAINAVNEFICLAVPHRYRQPRNET